MKKRNHLQLMWKVLPVFLLAAALAACGKSDSMDPDTENSAVEAEKAESGPGKETVLTAEESGKESTEESGKEGTEEPGKEGTEETGEAGQMQEEAETEKETAEPAQQTSSAWALKKLAICGDSISTFTGYIPDNYSKFYPENGDITDVEDTWWMQVVRRTGMELLKNASYSGATVSGQSADNHDGRFGCGNQRIADLAGEDGRAPDIILVLMGANDLLNDIPLGAYDGSSAVPEGNIETFSEAYALMLDKMKLWYPDAEIYCCTIAEVSRWNDETGEKFPYTNAHSLTAKDYNAWITAIAQAKGVKLIDVYSCGLTFENAKEHTSDGTHPNAAGAKLIADKVCETFK